MNRFNLVLGQGISRPPTPKVSGMLEVIAPEDGFVLEKCVPLSRHNGLGRTDAMKEQKNWQNGRLHVFGPKEVVIEPVQTVPRQNTLTRTSTNQNPKMTVRLHESIQEEVEIHNDPLLKDDLPKLNHETEIIGAKTESKEETFKNVEKTPHSEARAETQGSCVDEQNADEKPSDSSDDDGCNREQTGGKAEKRTAPLELMGEFLKAIMEREYSLAKKLCQMILIYEPQNPEAKQFLPLIERKLQLESIQEADGEGTDEESTEESDEETSDTEDSGTETEASSEESDT
ncbi:glutamate-rich protein 2 isoform X6 [Paroedura picta]|uniref:glutamate-rich protein 2 isoform X6 n=1 Tax=Paroedura picta TaxID=143630 RepID=UPI004055EDDF